MPISQSHKKSVLKRSERELLEIVKSGSLLSAAAEWELNDRGFNKSMESNRLKEDRAEAK